MKQIIYGPTGYGKSHLILHQLITKKNVIIVSTNGVQHEFEHVGLNNVPVCSIPIILEKNNSSPIVKIQPQNDFSLCNSTLLAFDIKSIPRMYETLVVDEILNFLENTGLTKDHAFTIVFINTYDMIVNSEYIRRIENWNADVIVDHTTDILAVEKYGELSHIRKSGKWFEIPVYDKMSNVQKKILEENIKRYARKLNVAVIIKDESNP